MRRTKPIILGIAGDSGSGKTTLARGIRQILGNEVVTGICIDDYHKYSREERKEQNLSALHPDCNYLDILQSHIAELRRGKAILKPVYDHSKGEFSRFEYVEPADFIVVEGLLAFHIKKLREMFDVKIYLDPEDFLRETWKIQRDTSERGYTEREAKNTLHRRAELSARYIRPQREHADIVLNFYPPPELPRETGSRLNARLILRPTIRYPDFSQFIDQDPDTEETCLSFTLGRDSGTPVDLLHIQGNISQGTLEYTARLILEHLSEAGPTSLDNTGRYLEGKTPRKSHPLALAQLLISFCLHKLKINR